MCVFCRVAPGQEEQQCLCNNTFNQVHSTLKYVCVYIEVIIFILIEKNNIGLVIQDDSLMRACQANNVGIYGRIEKRRKICKVIGNNLRKKLF
jgi:hypothetical protein